MEAVGCKTLSAHPEGCSHKHLSVTGHSLISYPGLVLLTVHGAATGRQREAVQLESRHALQLLPGEQQVPLPLTINTPQRIACNSGSSRKVGS